MQWPRIPLPGWPNGDTPSAAEELVVSAARGQKLAALLDSDTPVPGVTEGALRPEIASIAVPSIACGGNMTGDDFALTSGWGHFGQGEAVMPGQGRVIERPYTAVERSALGDTARTLGDHYLRHLPQRPRLLAQRPVQLSGTTSSAATRSSRSGCPIGSVRVLGRNLKPDEVQHFTNTARRIAAILTLVAQPLP